MEPSQENSPTQIEEKNIKMEPSVSLMGKKLWHMVQVVYFMLRKGISKGKVMMDFKLMMMKSNYKLSGKSKTILNLMFRNHHHHHTSTTVDNRRSHDEYQDFQFCPPPDEYEFSCSNSPDPSYNPIFRLPFNLNRRKNTHKDVVKALEMLNSVASASGSPVLPGFGKSPAVVRQLRITDSPFPLKDFDEDSHVDEDAEQFIEKFYKDLRRKNALAS